MAVSLVSTGIQFPDATIQTTAAAGGSGLVLLSSQTVSSETTYVTFSNVFSSTYDNYLVVFNSVGLSTSYAYTNGILQVQLQRSGSFVTTGYFGSYGTLTGGSTAVSSLDIGMTIGDTSKTNNNLSSGTLYCLGLNIIGGGAEARSQKFLGYTTLSSVSGSWNQLPTPNVATTGIRFFVESTNTNIAAGSFYIYGFKKS